MGQDAVGYEAKSTFPSENILKYVEIGKMQTSCKVPHFGPRSSRLDEISELERHTRQAKNVAIKKRLLAIQMMCHELDIPTISKRLCVSDLSVNWTWYHQLDLMHGNSSDAFARNHRFDLQYHINGSTRS